MYTYNTQTILAKNNKLQYITLIETSFFWHVQSMCDVRVIRSSQPNFLPPKLTGINPIQSILWYLWYIHQSMNG